MNKMVLLFSFVAATGFFCYGRYSDQLPNRVAMTVQGQRWLSDKTTTAQWEASFYEDLQKRTKKVRLPHLRTTTLAKQDIEMRFWYDARPNAINGFVLRRSGGAWSALGIRQLNDRWPSPVRRVNLGEPQSGWNAMWARLVGAGLLTLPDGLETKCNPGVLDGGGFVIETRIGSVYRTYRYSNPQFAECEGAKKVISVEGIIADEFHLQKAYHANRAVTYPPK
jgi:hypothetical protein